MKISELAELRRPQDRISPGNSEDELYRAFTWVETPEGHEFWDRVCRGNFGEYAEKRGLYLTALANHSFLKEGNLQSLIMNKKYRVLNISRSHILIDSELGETEYALGFIARAGLFDLSELLEQ